MPRYVTLPEQDDEGMPVVVRYPDADREEVTGAVLAFDPEMAPVLIDEVVSVTEVTTHPDGSTTTKSYEMQTGNKIPDPSGATEATGGMVERLTDAGGVLRVYQGDTVLHEYALGEWQGCCEEPPHWHADYVADGA